MLFRVVDAVFRMLVMLVMALSHTCLCIVYCVLAAPVQFCMLFVAYVSSVVSICWMSLLACLRSLTHCCMDSPWYEYVVSPITDSLPAGGGYLKKLPATTASSEACW